MNDSLDEDTAPRPGASDAAAPSGTAAGETTAGDERIAKVIARAGIASRRDAEALILAGRVTLDGKVVPSPALNVGPDARIAVDGEALPSRERTRLWLFHKPRGLVTTFKDPEGRPTVFDALPEDMPRVVAIGRLDMNTEGLLLLTNDGGLAKVVAQPETGWTRRYRARAYGEVAQSALDRLRGGITIDGMEYGPVEATLDRQQGDNSWITLALREGKNREVKRILEHLGLRVNRLLRLSFGPFQLGDLESGLVEEVRTRVLKDQLGHALAEEAGVDFASPVRSPIAPFGSPPKPTRPARMPQPRRANEGPVSGRPPGRDEGGFRDARGGRRERPDGGDAPRLRPRSDREEPARSDAWRTDDDAAGRNRPHRRGPREDPRAERAASAARPRERVAPIERDGRRVRVERIARDPATDDRPPRSGPRPPRPSGDRAGPPRDRPWGDRPPRRDDDGPPRGRPAFGKPPGGRPSFSKSGAGGGRPAFGRPPGGGRSFGAGDRPGGDGGRPSGGPGGRPGGRPSFGKPGPGGRPSFGKPGGRPGFGAKPGGRGKPFGGGGRPPPSGPRGDGPRRGGP